MSGAMLPFADVYRHAALPYGAEDHANKVRRSNSTLPKAGVYRLLMPAPPPPPPRRRPSPFLREYMIGDKDIPAPTSASHGAQPSSGTSRLGLMDVSSHIRTRIFSHLFDHKKKADPGHCCGYWDGEERHGVIELKTCFCRGALHPQILATSKTIFQEAMPLLYTDLELRVIFPVFDKPMTFPSSLVPILPDYGAQLIRSVVIVGDAYYSVIRTCRRNSSNEWQKLWVFWPAIWSKFPNIQTLRLHIDNADLAHIPSFKFQGFLGIAQFTKLRKVDLEMHCTGYQMEMRREQVEILMGMLKAFLIKEAEMVGRRIEVDGGVSVRLV